MDDVQLDAAAIRLAQLVTRRGAITTLAATATAGLLGRESADAAAACVHVGNRCKHAAQCCSGICHGSRGKKSCRSHGAGTCAPNQDDFCTDRDIQRANCNQTPGCSCYTTTGGARFCGQDASAFCPTTGTCARDADCGVDNACAVKLLACGGCPTSSGINFCIQPCPA
jgi:hypothetical protein